MNRRRGVVWWAIEARREGEPDLVTALGVTRASIQRAINGHRPKGKQPRPGLIELGYLERANDGTGGRARANEYRFGWLKKGLTGEAVSDQKGLTGEAVCKSERASSNTERASLGTIKGLTGEAPTLENLENPSERETEKPRAGAGRSRTLEGRAAPTPTEPEPLTAEQRKAIVAKLWREVEPGRIERPQWHGLVTRPARKKKGGK